MYFGATNKKTPPREARSDRHYSRTYVVCTISRVSDKGLR